MRVLILALMFVSANAKADQSDCLAKIMYAESRGESLEGLIVTAKSVLNRAKNNVCVLIRTGQVKAKAVPARFKAYYKALASTAINSSHDPSNGADSWNTGKKPAYPGAIKRIIGNHVYYKMGVL